MNIKEKIVKGYLSFSLGVWVNAVISFFTIPVVSWLIQPSEFGKANFFSVAYSLILQVVFLGVIPNGYMVLYHRTEKKRELFWTTLFLPFLFATVFLLFTFPIRYKINYMLVGQSNSLVYFLLLVNIFLGILQTHSLTTIRLKGIGVAYSTLQILGSLVTLIVTIGYALLISRDFYSLLFAQVLSHFIIFFVAAVRFEKDYWKAIHVDKELVKELLSVSYPFVVVGLLWWVLGWMDRIFIRIYRDFAEVGLYSAAFKLVGVLNLFTSGFSTFWFPFAYEQYEKNPENKKVFLKVFEYVFFATYFLSLTIILFKDIIFLLFSKSYRSAALISPFLFLNPISTMMTNVVARYIEYSKKTYWFFLSDGAAALFNFIGNFIFVTLLGAKGAAATTGLSYVIIFAIESTVVERLYPVGYNFRKVYSFIGLFVVIAAINTFIQNVFISVSSCLIGLLVVTLSYRSTFKELFSMFLTLLRQVFNKIFRKNL